MLTTLIIISALLIILSLLPFIQNQHWIFRVPEFIKLQLLIIQTVFIAISFYYIFQSKTLLYLQIAQIILWIYHVYLLSRFTKFWRFNRKIQTSSASNPVKIISCNIYQFNDEYQRFIDLINTEKPDIFLTMESDTKWEEALRVLEKDYPIQEKVTLDNTYGMHFYTKLEVVEKQTHFFVADDLPSIEVKLKTKDGQEFVFFGVHPPPPSPTEEENSKERDGDLLSVAKRIRDYKIPIMVTGDFNNVAWAKSSILFKKTSRLIDARIGRGFLATFHAKYWFFRVPLDLLYHSANMYIDKLFIYPSVGSDHYPMGCTFRVGTSTAIQEDEIKDLEAGEMKEVNDLIEDAKEEESDNRS